MFKNRKINTTLSILSLAACNLFASAEMPGFVMMNADRVAELQAEAKLENSAYQNEFQALYQDADKLIEEGKLYSTTFNDHVPPSGDNRDYYSTSPYWWPDPSKEDGLPYIRRDGETNPERDIVSDRKPQEHLIRDVGIVATAYSISQDEKYAEFAAQLIRTWFLDPVTGMNTNMQHGQAIAGRHLGKAGGIIGVRRYCLMVDYIRMIEGSKAWTEKDASDMNAWFSNFLDWLLVHPFGWSERMQENNHGTSYEMLVLALAIYTDRDIVAKEIIEEAIIPRMVMQIEEDGTQPYELVRTKAWNYSIENLKYLVRIALMAEKLDYDLFKHEVDGQFELKRASDYLLQYFTVENNWVPKHRQITKWQPERYSWIVQVLNYKYNDPSYFEALEKLDYARPIIEEYVYLPSKPATDKSGTEESLTARKTLP